MSKDMGHLEDIICRVRRELIVATKFLEGFIEENIDSLGGAFDK